MLFKISKEIDNVDLVIKNNVVLMIFILIISLLKFGVSIMNGLFVVFSSVILIAYKFLWSKMNESKHNVVVGLSYMINSLALFIIGFILADIQHILLVVLLIGFYIIEVLLVIYFVVNSSGEKDKDNSHQMKYSTGILLIASSIGIIISSYLRRTIEYDFRLLIAAFVFIGISYIFALGIKYIVIEVVNN